MSTNKTSDPNKLNAILDAALDLFVEQGFHGTTVPSIADKAGVGAGTIYRYFENKEALVNALYQKWKLKAAEAMPTNWQNDQPIREQLKEIWNQLFAFVKQYPKAFAFLELHHHASYLDTTSKSIEQTIEEGIIAFLGIAQEKEQTKPIEPRLLMAMGMGMFIGLIRECWKNQIQITDAIVNDFEQCIWEAFHLTTRV